MPGKWLAELRRRNVIRFAGLYLVAAWLIVQVAGTVLPMFDAPGWVARSIVVLLAIAFVPALVFAWVFELTPEGLKRDAEVPRDASIAPQTGRRMDRLIIVVLAIAVAYFGVDKFLLAPQRAAQPAATTASKPAAASERSIAVLPFANLSSDPEQAYFSDGLAEDLITALSQFDGLKVIARTSSFRFRGSSADPRAIGLELGVVHLLTGSVRRAGEEVRVSADLVDVSDGRTLWSERYDRPYADLFALQDEITMSVAQALRTRLLGDRVQDYRPASGNLAAYNAFLQGRFHSDRGGRADYPNAFEYLEEAIRLDPTYAQAYAALASARVLEASIFFGHDEAQAALAKARELLRKAVELAPDSWYVQVVDARVKLNGELDWVAAERAARRAVELAPSSLEARNMLAQSRAALGDADGAVQLTRSTLQGDPLNVTALYWLSVTLGGLGRLDEAQAAIDRAMDLTPNSEQGAAQRAIVAILRGRDDDALRMATAMPEGNWRNIAVALASQRGSDAATADQALANVIATSSDGSAFQLAEIYALRSDPENAFAWLDRAWENRDPGLRRLLTDPFLAPYRKDPRFAAFCAEIGLPPPKT